MNNQNVLSQIKNLHHLIGINLFKMHQNEGASQPPSPLQMNIISVLQDRSGEEIFLKDIQEELHVSKAAISDALEKMEKKGFISKKNCSLDARKQQIILNKDGREVFLESMSHIDHLNEKISLGLTQKEMEDFYHICHKIEMILEREGKE